MTAATVGFEQSILPLLTPIDIIHMQALDTMFKDYAHRKQLDNAMNVYERLTRKSLPPPAEPRSDENIALFNG